MRKRPLLWIACVFLTGLACERYDAAVLFVIPLLFLLQELKIAARHCTWKRFAGRSILLLSAFLFGCVHMHKEEAFREAYLSKLRDGNQVTVWGEIKSIDTTEYGVRCILTDCFIRIHEEEGAQRETSEYTEYDGRKACNDIMVYTSSTHYQVGQIHEITGQFKGFSTARNQGNFDSRVFYQSQKIDFQVEEESARFLGSNQNWIAHFLLELRDEFRRVFLTGMSEHAAGFYAGMVLGDKSGLSETTKNLFLIGGISHILAISGLHVSIIGRRLYIRLRKRRVSFLIAGGIAGIILLMYCYMVGSNMSTVRAVGMMLLYFLAQYWGRGYDMLNALGGMSLLLLLENPFLLEYSGFWFSVLALLGVGCVGPALVDAGNDGTTFVDAGHTKITFVARKRERLFRRMTESFWMSTGIALSTLPVVAYSYYEIPLYSTLVNMAVLPLLTPVFLLAIVGGIVGLWLPDIAGFLFVPCEWLLHFYEWLCGFVSTLPSASIVCGSPSTIIIVLYYCVLFAVVWCLGNTKNTKEESISGQTRGYNGCKKFLLSGICLFLIIYPKPKPFEITFLDVGQGDGIYISTGDGMTCFIDGGSTSVNELGKYRILPFLKSKGVADIDYWFVTHADTDHISGLLEVLSSGYSVKHVVLAEAAPKDENYGMLMTLAEQSGAKVLYMEAGDKITTSHIVLNCIYPSKAVVADRNEASLVLEVKVMEGTENFRALFTGDISAEVEDTLIQNGDLSDVYLYKAAHHGSKYSNSTEMLEVIKPEVAVISCSEKNLYGHPAPEVVDRMEACGALVLYTMRSGQITVDEEGNVRYFIDDN